MVDINLFSPYIEEERESKNKNIYIFVGLAAFITISALYTGWYFYTVNSLEKNITEMNTYLNSKEIQEKLVEIEGKREQITILQDYYNSVKGINGQVAHANVINTKIINNINSSIPGSVYFDSMKIVDRIIEIHGTSDSRTTLAQFQHKLSLKDDFTNVYITSMAKDSLNDNYIFVLTLIVEGDKNEIE